MKSKQIFVLLGALLLCVLLLMAGKSTPVDDPEVAKLTEQEAKEEIALAYVLNSKMPMKGILMLKDMLEEDPENTRIRKRLAEFAVQTKQFDVAAKHYRILAEQYEGTKKAYSVVNLFDALYFGGVNDTEKMVWAILEMQKMRGNVDDSLVSEEIEKRLREFNNIKEN